MPIQKLPGKLYSGIAIPAANEELTVGAGGVPDATENPNAKYIGETDGGWTSTITKEIAQEFVDEYKQPVEQYVEQVAMMIKGDLVMKTLDIDVLALVTAGAGTKVLSSGIEKITYGESTITPTGVALIFPLKSDPTKYGVFHIYSAYNQASIERVVSRQNRMVLPVEFVGLAITSRAATDTIGAEFKQVAVV